MDFGTSIQTRGQEQWKKPVNETELITFGTCPQKNEEGLTKVWMKMMTKRGTGLPATMKGGDAKCPTWTVCPRCQSSHFEAINKKECLTCGKQYE